jgi:hypothetical protein
MSKPANVEKRPAEGRYSKEYTDRICSLGLGEREDDHLQHECAYPLDIHVFAEEQWSPAAARVKEAMQRLYFAGLDFADIHMNPCFEQHAKERKTILFAMVQKLQAIHRKNSKRKLFLRLSY